MNIEEFINLFREELIDSAPELINESCEFKNLPDWSSLVIMILTTRLDDEFNVSVTREQINNSKTLAELYTSIINNNES